MTVTEIVANTDRRPTDAKLHRVRIHVKGRRYLFGVKVNDHGFLSDSGRVLKINGDDQLVP